MDKQAVGVRRGNWQLYVPSEPACNWCVQDIKTSGADLVASITYLAHLHVELCLIVCRMRIAEHYPYLLVNIGSGVSMVRVDGEHKFTRVSGESCAALPCASTSHGAPATTSNVPRAATALLSCHCHYTLQGPVVLATPCRAGTNIGGGTFWGLCKLLTGMDNFDDILSLSSQGDNSNVGGLCAAV